MSNGVTENDFADKLALVLKALVLSRAGLAREINVDKSLVGRWVSGTVKPSEHNRAKLTRFVAERVEGFTLLDWDRDLDSLRHRLGVKASTKSSPTGFEWVPPSLLEISRNNVAQRGQDYVGLWKSTRASNDLPGRFVHDICLIQLKDGMLYSRIGVEGVRYNGWTLLLQHQCFSITFEEQSLTMLFSIYNGVARDKPEVLDGVNLATLRDAGGSPAASASVLHRISDITGNHDKDIALFEKTIAELNPLADEGAIAPDVARHLTESVTDGSPGLLRLLYGQSMARGSVLS